MRTPKKSVLDHLIKQLPGFVVTDRLTIPDWYAVPGRHVAPGVFEKRPEEGQQVHLGHRWVTTYDETVWFTASVDIPDRLVGKKLYLSLIFGGEAIVRINGEIAGGISAAPGTGWVNRDIIFLPDPLPRKLDIEVESTVNCGEFCDYVLGGAKDITYTLSTAEIIAVDPATESYVNDVQIVSESLEFIQDEVVRERVYRALDDSLHAVDYDFDAETLRQSVPAAAKLLWDTLDAIHYTPQGNVIMTGHSHIDVAWLWTVKEVFRKCARTFSNSIELLKRYPDAVFVQSQAKLYDMVKTVYPELMPKIKELVDNGQWDIVGNAWVEADTNVASGESLIRQLLYGEAFFRKEFGVSSDIYWLPDCFGFSPALPQIIRKSGMKYFVTAKLSGNDTNRFPYTTFKWRGTDGSEVLGYLTRAPYGGDYKPWDVYCPWHQNENKAVNDTVLGMFGYGDGGGGPTLGMVENGRRIAKIPGMPASKIGHVSEFFAEAEKERDELPVWNGELYYENHRGTYTSQAFVKKNNRKGEILLAETEFARTALALLSGQKPESSDELTALWKTLLVNQFHDILPGTSIPEVFENTKLEQEQVLADGKKMLDEALAGIAGKLPAGLAVFNPTSVPFSGYVKDSAGNAYIAENVPAVGYSVLKETVCPEAVYCKDGILENRYLRAAIDGNGYVTSLIYKDTGREALSGTGNVIKVYADKPVHESAWNMEADYVKRSWTPVTDEITFQIEGCEGVVIVKKHFNRSAILQKIRLVPDGKRLDFETTFDWHETEKTVRVDFPVNVLSEFAAFDIAHGAIRRPTHRNTTWDIARFEVSAHKWGDISEGDFGVALLNDCKYGYSALDNVLSLTMLRSPNCPDQHADQGEHSFVYALYPHQGNWQTGGVSAEAFRLNMPVRMIQTTGTDALPTAASLVNFGENDNIKLDCFKPAEEQDGIIIRMYETCQRRGNVRVNTFFRPVSVAETDMLERPLNDGTAVSFDDKGFDCYFKPFEVKTFLVRFEI